jgi:large subunit ribosomal protein L13
MKSFMASPATIERKWYVVDATGHTLGRLSSEIAAILRGRISLLLHLILIQVIM